jgi:rSAM/selenodomain-associated transferase 1
MTKDSAVITFIKAPEKGKVKTRLAKTIGDTAALALYQCFVMDVLSTVQSTRRVTRIYYHPEKSCNRIRSWLGDELNLFAQSGDTLGEKMKNALAETFTAGYSRAIIIGTDLPDLPAEIIENAFNGLKKSNAVIGPSQDGGYYLIGFTAPGFLPEVFDDISWGTERVFSQTMNAFLSHAVSPEKLPVWRDVDTREDLEALIQNLNQAPGHALHTQKYLKSRQKRFIGKTA